MSAPPRRSLPHRGELARCRSMLPVVAQRLDHRQHLLERDEAAAVDQLVRVDRAGQIAGLGRRVSGAKGIRFREGIRCQEPFPMGVA